MMLKQFYVKTSDFAGVRCSVSLLNGSSWSFSGVQSNKHDCPIQLTCDC